MSTAAGGCPPDGCRFDINKNWRWGWDATAVSDREFFDNYDINTDNMNHQQLLRCRIG